MASFNVSPPFSSYLSVLNHAVVTLTVPVHFKPQILFTVICFVLIRPEIIFFLLTL